ncbi:MAG: serine/threonine protein kinase [Planctomycetia bacterium]|nr:serine/threonine protein kinase [Planctomycetia bacterium]
MAITLEQFGKSIISTGLLTNEELRAWWTSLAADRKPRDAESFAACIVQDGKLTSYQSQVLLQGKGASLSFGNYLLLAQIGVGASGAVFKGKHKSSGRLVAIKVLSSAIAQDDVAVRRFQREIEAAGRLAHPNIVQSFDAGQLNGQHYLVMEYVDGADLTTLVKDNGVFSIDMAIRTISQAAAGLQYAHEQGVIHRDIKPRNLLQDKQGGVRLLDLGLVRFSDGGSSITATQAVMGTIDYMSPEQAVDPKRADVRSDIYSLGCTLWFLLVGRKLYDAKGVVDRIMMHRSSPIPLLMKEREAPKALQAVFEKMVAKRPDDRYQTMSEVIVALAAVAKEIAGPSGDDSEQEEPVEMLAEVEMLSEQSIMNLPRIQLQTAAYSEPGPSKPFLFDQGAKAVSQGTAKSPSIQPTPAKGKAASPKAFADSAEPGNTLASRFPVEKRTLYIAGAVVGVVLLAVVVWLVIG